LYSEINLTAFRRNLFPAYSGYSSEEKVEAMLAF